MAFLQRSAKQGKSVPAIRRATVIEQSLRVVRKRPVNFHA